MKPVDQTKFGPVEGNCFGACVASLLELTLDDVADLQAACEACDRDDSKHWYVEFEKWLLPRGYRPFCIYQKTIPGHAPVGYCLAGGKSHRDLPHSVIFKDGEMVHDPHPDRTGIGDVEEYIVLVSMVQIGSVV